MKLKVITNKFMLLSLIILSPITMSHEMDRDCIKHNHLSPNNRYIPQINSTKVCLYNEDDFQGESMCLSHEQGIDLSIKMMRLLEMTVYPQSPFQMACSPPSIKMIVTICLTLI